MRRRSVLLAVPALMLTAAGCGDDSKGSSSTPSSSSSTTPPASPTDSATGSATPSAEIVSGPVPAITAGTGFNQKPTVAKGTGTPSDKLAVKTVIKGDGAKIAGGDYVQVNYVGQIWNTGKVFDTSFGKSPYTNVIGQGKLIPGWDQGLIGQQANSRVEMAIPPSLGYGDSGNAQAGIKGTDTLVFVIDVLERFDGKSSSKGKVVPQTDAKLPKSGTNTDGKMPSLTIPKGVKAPTKLVSAYILEGDGPVIKSTDSVLAQYQGKVWSTGKEFDSSYSRGELAAFELSQLIQGWQQGLVGKKAGSRVLLVTPGSLAYGANPPSGSGIPKNATLVFTLDVLAVL
ncbi:putative FK-506 binding protein, peptidyl-prolyl cis-trans isomerase [Actinacidiphila reveromycinica]|uniref:peptidylprolyl isomerase n=1 Tax=Actinacidiphila reveromycinica TaxID=659352 RepID=A0A7U3UP61_9ACTN|nr:FKBP-type peptidyl-prolyl cis-trans isomerase [Streptomyces sp. SN-593]BBA96158.1 putative FK-506 binding protein, peptidyl-prolyl cis-trans isomerase [Streptomyces sp. SN-593]